VKTLSPAAVDALKRHPFPGNVRELENVLERASALCDGATIEVEDLHLPSVDRTMAAEGGPPGSEVALESYLGEIERQAILRALEETHWNRTAAARKLGMTLRSLRYRLAKLGIE
jgi:two-component system response regulator PilR (NtrC family)